MKFLILSSLFIFLSASSFAEEKKLYYCMVANVNYFAGGPVTKEECHDHFLKTLNDRKYFNETTFPKDTKSNFRWACNDLRGSIGITWGRYHEEVEVLPRLRCPLLRSVYFLDIDYPDGPDPYDYDNDEEKHYCMIENTYAAVNIGGRRGRLTKQQCIDTVYYNLLKGKFFNQKNLIKKSCMREKNSLSFHWGYSQGKDPFMTIKCSLWNKWLKDSRPEYIHNFDYR